MSNNVNSDVQLAIQSSTIQTAQERNTSALSSEAFNSYLTKAPIPRIALLGDTQVIPDSTLTTITWNATNTFDPYGMFTSPIIRIPLDGFYSFDCNIQHNFTGAYNTRWIEYLSDTSAQFGAAYQLACSQWEGTASIVGAMNVACVRPFNAGDSFHINVFQSSGGPLNLGGNLCNISGAWIAPFSSSQGAGVQ